MRNVDSKCKIYPKDIYLESNQFITLCNELKIEADERLLEAYEMHDLIYPIYRINRPKEYLQKIFEQNYGPDRCENIIEVPDEYGNLLKFEYEKLDRWHHPIFPEFDRALTEGHPLDQAYNKGDKFILKPSKEPFKS